jgi:hypothetical protein
VGATPDGGDRGPIAGDDAAGPTCGARGEACCASGMCELRASCDGTACIAADVWASGVDGLANFNGGTWAHPLLGGTTSQVPGVTGLWGTTASFVVGVGAGGLILRKDDAGWHKDQAASADGTGSLYAVAGASATDVWAVGDGVMVHYDGNGWTSVVAPLHDGEPYTGVWMSGPGTGWATGQSGILAQLTAGTWASVSRQGNGYDKPAIWGTSATNIWRVGENHTLTGLPGAIQHYDGTSWTTASLNGGGMLPPLSAVWGSDASHVWAVGEQGTIVFFDGSLWKPILSNTTEDLKAIWGSGPNDVWVAGASSVFHFNGTAWAPLAATGLPSAPSAVWLSVD